MNDKENIYLDKVIEFLVRDTKIDYDKDEIQFPYLFARHFSLRCLVSPFSSLLIPFSKYCKVTYGLTDQEIRYVWEEYKNNINNER